MNSTLSLDTVATLLLTASLGQSRRDKEIGPLSHGEYNALARLLAAQGLRPSSLLELSATDRLAATMDAAFVRRLDALLQRGFLLAQRTVRWEQRGIWVCSRADSDYPQRLRNALREKAPPVLFGCGPLSVLQSHGLAVVGSRHADDRDLGEARHLGALAADAGLTVISGGARGVDQAAMFGATDAGGRACGVLSDSLWSAVVRRDYRDSIIDGRLVLMSAEDPEARFFVGAAMKRNAYIHRLADASVVVVSDLGRGGTWAGAVEHLTQSERTPLFVWPSPERPALAALVERGARWWPEPASGAALTACLAKPSTLAEEPSAPASTAPDAPAIEANAMPGHEALCGRDEGDAQRLPVPIMASSTPGSKSEHPAQERVSAPAARRTRKRSALAGAAEQLVLPMTAGPRED